MDVDNKELNRPYREERLLVRRRGGRRRALGPRAPMPIPRGRNQRWSPDFASDTLIDGRRLRILCVIDDFTRVCLSLVADNSISGVRVARELTALIERRGRPFMIVSDNGTELTGCAILKWQRDRHVEWHYLQPPLSDAAHRLPAMGKPQQNAFFESFIGRFRESASTRISSRAALMPARSSKHGGSPTIPTDRIRSSEPPRTNSQPGSNRISP